MPHAIFRGFGVHGAYVCSECITVKCRTNFTASLQQRLVDWDRGLTSCHEFNVLRDLDYLAALLAGGHFQTIGETQRAGRCQLCREKDRAGSLKVLLFERLAGTPLYDSRRQVTLHRACYARVAEAAAQECIELLEPGGSVPGEPLAESWAGATTRGQRRGSRHETTKTSVF